LKPVSLLQFLDTLFGRDIFICSDRPKFDDAFGVAHVNFTHWIITQDSIPDSLRNRVRKYDIVNASLRGPANLYTRRQPFAYLWARGGALQCRFPQESIEFLIPLYLGSVDPDSEFDPSRLSGSVRQVEFKVAGDKKAEATIRPIGIPRDRQQPLPYLAILMEVDGTW
jgi:hypothetical protein